MLPEAAVNYDQLYQSEEVYGGAADRLTRWLGQATAGERVLDLGAGQGRNARYLLQLGYGVEAVEASAVAHAQLARMPLVAIRCDMTDYPFHPERFDGVVAVTALSALPEEGVERVFQGIERTLKPGGWFYLEDFTRDDPGESPCSPLTQTRFEPSALRRRWSHWRLLNQEIRADWDLSHPPRHRHVTVGMLLVKP